MQEEGVKTIERKIIVDHDWSLARDKGLEHLVREDVATVTYFWKRIPDTPFTVLVSVLGSPADSENSTMQTPSLNEPQPCPKDVSMLNKTSMLDEGDTCWTSTYSNFPSVYHRLDLLKQSNMPARFTAPFGGEEACCCEMCTYDTSTWLGSPSTFSSDKGYRENEPTTETIEAVNKEMLGARADETMLGNGLRQRAMKALKITSNMEAFWKSVLGVEGADDRGNAQSLNPNKAKERHDILQLLFASENGILRMYPGAQATVPNDYNVRREPYYTRALSHPDEIAVSQPYLPATLNSSIWTVTFSKVRKHMHSRSARRVDEHPTLVLRLF